MYDTPIITKDFENKKIVIEKKFSAPRSKVWKAHSDANILVQWWGPKEWPAGSDSFDFRDGGHWHYHMTGPDGTKVWGWIDYTTIVPEESIRSTDSFADAEGNKDTSLPSNNWFMQFQDNDENTLVIVELTFDTTGSMQTLIDMGFEAGFSDALNNLDMLLPKL